MLKNKIIGKKIRNILILLMAIIIMIGAYRFINRSKAEKVIEFTAIAIDNSGILEDEELILEAKQLEDENYEIELPENINSKIINQILKVNIDGTPLEGFEDTTEAENTAKFEDTAEVENTTKSENTAEAEDITKSEDATEAEEIEKRIYLTKEQIENSQVSIIVEYDSKEIEQTETTEYNILYNKILKYEDKENDKLVELKGYLPKDAKLQVEEVQQEQLTEIFGDKKAKVKVAYDIKILLEVLTTAPTDEENPDAEPEQIIETIEINPEEFDEKCEVTIKDVNILEKSEVYHVKEDNTYEKVIIKDNSAEGNVSFEAQAFSVYAVTDGEIEPDPGEETGSGGATITQYKLTYADGTENMVYYGSSNDLTVQLPPGGSVTIYFASASCRGRGDEDTCYYNNYSGVEVWDYYEAKSERWFEHQHGGTTHSDNATKITILDSLEITVSPTSCDWRNSALSTTISVNGNASSGSYKYYLSTSSTALSGGSWATYTSGTAVSLSPATTGTYYLFVERLYNADGDSSTSNGTDVTINGTTYHRFGPYKFDYINPVAGNLTIGGNGQTVIYTNQSSVNLYASGMSDDDSGINENKIYFTAWYGGNWVTYNNSKTGTYDSTNNRYSASYTFSEIKNTSTGNTNQGEGGYKFKTHVYDKAGNRTISPAVYAIYDTTSPKITASSESCGWRNSALNMTITATDPTPSNGGENSGLASSNSYQYYLSNSSTALSGGSWKTYTSGSSFNLSPETSGTYYLFVKRVSDNAGNTSSANGTATTVSGTTYHRFGPYKFDFEKPVWTIQNKTINADNKTISFELIGSDAISGLSSSSSLTTDDITVYYDTNELAVGVTKSLSGPVTLSNGSIKYILTISNADVAKNGYYEFTPTNTIVGRNSKI